MTWDIPKRHGDETLSSSSRAIAWLARGAVAISLVDVGFLTQGCNSTVKVPHTFLIPFHKRHVESVP